MRLHEQLGSATAILALAVPLWSIGLGPAETRAGERQADAIAALFDLDGEPVGSVTFFALPHGTLLHARLTGMPVGAHAFHVHETGICEPPFDSAGGHYDPDDAAHGFVAEDGYHAGDFPNIHVPATGRLEVEFFSTALVLDERLFDEDGASVVIHAEPDDYVSQPAGDAGPRIACGVIEPA